MELHSERGAGKDTLAAPHRASYQRAGLRLEFTIPSSRSNHTLSAKFMRAVAMYHTIVLPYLISFVSLKSNHVAIESPSKRKIGGKLAASQQGW